MKKLILTQDRYITRIFRPFKYKYMYTNLNNNAFTNMTNKELSRKRFQVLKEIYKR